MTLFAREALRLNIIFCRPGSYRSDTQHRIKYPWNALNVELTWRHELPDELLILCTNDDILMGRAYNITFGVYIHLQFSFVINLFDFLYFLWAMTWNFAAQSLLLRLRFVCCHHYMPQIRFLKLQGEKFSKVLLVRYDSPYSAQMKQCISRHVSIRQLNS